MACLLQRVSEVLVGCIWLRSYLTSPARALSTATVSKHPSIAFIWCLYRLKLGWPGIWSFGAAVPVGIPGAAILPVGVVLAETESMSMGSDSAMSLLVPSNAARRVIWSALWARSGSACQHIFCAPEAHARGVYIVDELCATRRIVLMQGFASAYGKVGAGRCLACMYVWEKYGEAPLACEFAVCSSFSRLCTFPASTHVAAF